MFKKKLRNSTLLVKNQPMMNMKMRNFEKVILKDKKGVKALVNNKIHTFE